MKQLWKRNAVVGTILVFVCAAIFLNGKYAEKVDKPTKVLGQSELVSHGRRRRRGLGKRGGEGLLCLSPPDAPAGARQRAVALEGGE